MRGFRIDELSGCDFPAQEGATVAIMKRGKPEQVKKYGTSMYLTTEVDGHQHGIDSYRSGCDCGCVSLSVEYSSDLQGNNHSHPITIDPLAIGASVGHSHEIEGTIIVKAHEEATMVTKNDDPTTTDPTLESVQAENQRLSSIVGLTSEERSHFDALPDNMRTAFLGKSAGDRQSEIVAKNSADPIVYTTTDGIELRKSQGEAIISIAKSNDELRKTNNELLEKAAQASLEKRADTRAFSHARRCGDSRRDAKGNRRHSRRDAAHGRSRRAQVQERSWQGRIPDARACGWQHIRRGIR